MKQVPIHPICELFPPLPEEELSKLAEHIGEHGLQHKIILYEGKILDGRHRYAACKLVGVDPKFEQYKGEDPIGLVMGSNFFRRHLDTSQRAMIAAKAADLKRGESGRKSMAERRTEENGEKTANLRLNVPTHSEAATLAGVSLRSVDTASKILDEAPKKVVQAVVNGEMSLNAAAKAIKAKAAAKETVRDSTDYEIPEPLHELWARRDEVMAMLRTVAEVRNKLEGFQKSKDILFSTVRFTDVLMSLDRSHQEIKNAQLWAVCTSCQGHQPGRCALCKGRGILSKFAWDSFVPVEIKAVRSKRK